MGSANLACLLIALWLLGAGCAHFAPLIQHSDPLSAQEHAQLGVSYEEQGLKKEAVSQYKAAVKKDPAYVEGWVALGNLLFNEGDLSGAERSYKRALKTLPQHAAANNNLAMVYLAQNKNLNQAEHLALLALEEDSALKPYALDTLASIYLRQKRYSQAKAILDQAKGN